MKTTKEAHKVTQTWDISKMQQAATKMVSHKIASRVHFLEKHRDKEIDQMEKASAHLNSEMLLKCGLKTPLDLVKFLADYEVNMFGSEASISGDDECATMITDKSSVWVETKQANNFSEDQTKAMEEHYGAWMKDLGHKFGFKVHVEIAKDGSTSEVTFKTN